MSLIAFFPLITFVGLPLLVIWLAKGDRSRAREWDNQISQRSIMVGAELDMPRILPVEPVRGLTVNGAPVDDLTHIWSVKERGANAPNP